MTIASSKKSNSLILIILFLIIITVVLTIIFALKDYNRLKPVVNNANNDNQENNNKDINELFIADMEDSRIVKVSIFNISKKEIVISKTITLDDSLGSASTNSSGSNNSVQYNPKTKDIFISTVGFSYYDGSCINKDGTCNFRIYKFNLHNNDSSLFFESNEGIANWIVNSFDNSVLIRIVNEKTETIKKINAQNSQINFEKIYLNKDNVNEMEFVVSSDGKYIYQASKESVDGKWIQETLSLRKIDNSNGEITEQQIFKGEAIDFETDISPNNQYFAFYSGNQGPAKFYVFDILNQELINLPYRGRIKNYNLIWSGDSRKILYLLENQLSYYDILKSKSFVIDGNLKDTPYVFMWGPSSDYLLYESVNGVNIYDIENSQAFETSIRKQSIEIQGFLFY
jgi:hypothetical protein